MLILFILLFSTIKFVWINGWTNVEVLPCHAHECGQSGAFDAAIIGLSIYCNGFLFACARLGECLSERASMLAQLSSILL